MIRRGDGQLIATRIDFRVSDGGDCTLEFTSEREGRYRVSFPEAQVWKLLRQLVEVEGELRTRRARRKKPAAN